MLTVKTFIKFSDIHGIGCFAGEDIKKGDLVWRFDERVDMVFDEEDFAKFPDSFKDFLSIYAYSPVSEDDKVYILCADHAKHMNHSTDPNLFESPEGDNIALRDIKKGEELTCDYNVFDKDASVKLG